MANPQIKSVLSHPLEVATALLFVCALFYVGSASGAVLILAIVGVVAAGALLAEIHVWLSGEHAAVMAARRAEMNSDKGGSGLRGATGFAVFLAALAEIFWYTSAFIPDVRYGVVTTTPSAWILAHLTAAPAVLVAYRHSPAKYRVFLSVSAFAFVLSSLVISSIVPFYFADR